MKEFNEVFNSIPRENLEELEVLRKKECKVAKIEFLIIIMFLLATGVNIYIGKMIILCEIIIIFVTYYLSRKTPVINFLEKYKQYIIKPIVESYNNKIIYDIEQEITKEEYSETGYSTGDEFYSSNYFETMDKSIRASAITIIDKSEDKDGNTRHTTIFSGVFSIITLNNFSKEVIRLKSNNNLRNFIIGTEDKLEVDSSEFEEKFDLYCKNKIYTMQLFTSDVLKLLVELSKNNRNYDFILNGNKLYVRYHNKSIFYVKTKNSMKRQSIEKIYNDTYDVLDLLTNLKETIDKKLDDIN